MTKPTGSIPLEITLEKNLNLKTGTNLYTSGPIPLGG